jgi:hypothetical protein
LFLKQSVVNDLSEMRVLEKHGGKSGDWTADIDQ